MRKRNKYFKREKEFIRLKKRLSENWKAQSRLGWVDLEIPEFIGYTAYLEPREDIQNRDDSWIFWYICESFGTTAFAKKIIYFDWEWPTGRRRRWLSQNYTKPRISSIDRLTYYLLPPQVQKWFTDKVPIHSDDHKVSKWYKWNYYYCNVPDFYFEIKYKKEYKTRIKLYSPILEQEESEIKSKLISDFYYENKRKNSKAPKSFRKLLNRSQRAKSKQVLHNIVYKNKEQEFLDNYKGADWLWD